MKYMYNVDDYEHAYLRVSGEDLKAAKIQNPLHDLGDWEKENYHLHILRIMRNPKYIHWTVKHILGVDLLPEQCVILQELWTKAFPMYIASRGFGKSYLLAVYAMLRCLLVPGSKIVVVGAAFRQSKVIFEYMDVLWKNAPLFRSLCSDNSGPRRDVDRCTLKVNDSWTIAVPLGDGSKIRGLRAHTIIADEFNSIPVEIYETVVAGFAAVAKEPVDNVKEAAKRKAMQEDDEWTEGHEEVYKERHQNQSILSGTAGYDFEPFADYWKIYKKMIKYKTVEEGEEEEGNVPEYMQKLDRGQFSIIRMPYELIPEGFMDDQQVSRSRATMHSGIYMMEYGAVFAKDSQGFYKRTLIEGCTANEKQIAKPGWPAWCETPFNVMTRGTANGRYVFGIDPASENDNFAIIVIELRAEHHRIVYSWTTSKKDFQQRKKLGLTEIDDYYSFCVRKIRDLYRLFPCVSIGIDSQGGGYAIAEGLRDKDKMMPGERPILPTIDEKKEKDTDMLDGDHILEFIQFANAVWTSQSNHGLRKDMEDRVALFPQFDNITLSLVSEHDKRQFADMKDKLGDNAALKLYDTLEDAVLEIEELKTELSTITVSRTATGRERFDTPEIKLKTGKKGRMRKDRYSALIIANMIARSMEREITPPAYRSVGRIATVPGGKGHDPNKGMYSGQGWQGYSPSAVRVIKRK